MYKYRLAALGLWLLTSAASAATITVNSTADTGDTVAGDGTCGTAAPNTCTLRAAISEAEGNTDPTNTIVFATGSGAPTATTLTSSLPNITKSLVITGPSGGFTITGNTNKTLTSNSAFRFTGSGGAYSITNIKISNAVTTDSLGGAGVYFAPAGASTLILDTMTITGCDSKSGPGGGIAIDVTNGSTVTMKNLVLGGSGTSKNTASTDGGGLWVRVVGSGTLTLDGSSIIGNTATNGAGISVRNGRLQISDTTISGNIAGTIGGGIYLDSEGAGKGGNVRLENSTLSANTAAQGGGIGVSDSNGTASWVTFSTITANIANTAGKGGGLYAATPNTSFPGNLSNPFTSNIVGGNTGGNCNAAVSHSDTANSGFNLTDSSSCGFAQATDQVVASTAAMKVAGLAANPVAPNTHALLAGSPAIDHGNPGWTTGADERGADVQDGDLSASVVPDVGAYEFGGFGLVQFAAANFDVNEDVGSFAVPIKRYGTGTAASTAAVVSFQTADGAAKADTAGTPCAKNDNTMYYVAPSNNPNDFTFATTGVGQFDQSSDAIQICNDSVVDAPAQQAFNISLAKSTASGAFVAYDLGPLASGTVTLHDADNGAFTLNGVTLPPTPEGNTGTTPVSVTITRRDGAHGAVRVTYETLGLNGTTNNCSPTSKCPNPATSDTDYTSVTAGTVDFADGQASKDVTLSITGDTAFEKDEQFQMHLTGVSCLGLSGTQTCDARLYNPSGNATPNKDANNYATITIQNDDVAKPGQVQFELASYTATKGAGASLAVKVKRVGGTDGAVTVTYSATDGTASSSASASDPDPDYALPTGTPPGNHNLTWAGGTGALPADDQTFNVSLFADTGSESDKTFTLNLALSGTNCPDAAAPSNCSTVGPSVIVTLHSNMPPSFQFKNATDSVSEPNSIVLHVTSSTFTGPAVQVSADTTDGTANSPADYTAVSTNLSFDGSGTDQTVTIGTHHDQVEPNETFNVVLGTPTNGGTLGANSTDVVTIIKPTAIRFTASNFSSTDEQNNGTLTVTAERVGDNTNDASVTYTISQACNSPAPAGCATEGTDYTHAGGFSGSMSWTAKDTGSSPTQSFTITLLGDTQIEGDEIINVALSQPSSTTGTAPVLGLSQATATITDDDYQFVIVDVSPLQVGEGAGNAVISVRRVGSTVGAASVKYATADGTAKAGTNYTSTTGTLNWAAGEGCALGAASCPASATKTITVPITDDTAISSTLNFTVALNTPSNNVSGEATPVLASPITVQILDNDSSVAFSTATQTVAESVGTVTVTATRTGASSYAINVPFTVSGTAANPADHNAASGTINIPANASSGSYTFNVVDDSVVETSETVIFTMGTPSAATGSGTVTAASPTTQTVTITDNDTAGVTVTQSGGSTAVAEGGASDTYTLVLTSQPTANVTIAIAGDSSVTATPTSVVFTSANWDVPQTVTVKAVDDQIVQGTHTGTIKHTVTSADPQYNARAVPNVTVQVTDNDSVTVGQNAPGVVVTPNGQVASGSGTGGGAFSWTSLLALLALVGLRQWGSRRALATLLCLLPLHAGAATAPAPKAPAPSQSLSYDSMDLRYLGASLKDPSATAAGFGLDGSWAVSPTVSVLAGYGSMGTSDFQVLGITGSSKTSTVSLGVGWHQSVSRETYTDFTSSISLLKASAKGQGGFTGSSNDTGYDVDLGFRGLLERGFEWGAGLSYVSIFSDSDTAVTGQLLYHFNPHYSALLGLSTGSNSTGYSFGLRYAF